MKPALILTGSHASGKTTLATAVSLRTQGRALVVCDNRKQNVWRSTVGIAFEAASRLWLSEPNPFLFEGVDQSVRPFLRAVITAGPVRSLKIVVLIQEPTVMAQHLALRAETGPLRRKPRRMVWTNQKLLYEGAKKYPALMQTYAPAWAEVEYVVVDAAFEVMKPLEDKIVRWLS